MGWEGERGKKGLGVLEDMVDRRRAGEAAGGAISLADEDTGAGELMVACTVLTTDWLTPCRRSCAPVVTAFRGWGRGGGGGGQGAAEQPPSGTNQRCSLLSEQ